MNGQCDKALDSASEVCPVCFRVHEPRPPEPHPYEATYQAIADADVTFPEDPVPLGGLDTWEF